MNIKPEYLDRKLDWVQVRWEKGRWMIMVLFRFVKNYYKNLKILSDDLKKYENAGDVNNTLETISKILLYTLPFAILLELILYFFNIYIMWEVSLNSDNFNNAWSAFNNANYYLEQEEIDPMVDMVTNEVSAKLDELIAVADMDEQTREIIVGMLKAVLDWIKD